MTKRGIDLTCDRPAELADYRREIDALDEELVALLGRRFAIVRDVAALKKARAIPAFLPDRVREVIDRCAAAAPVHALDAGFVAALYGLIVGEACRLEARLIEAEDETRAGNQ